MILYLIMSGQGFQPGHEGRSGAELLCEVPNHKSFLQSWLADSLSVFAHLALGGASLCTARELSRTLVSLPSGCK